jgi:nucleotide-binding universal stress UspA family protein
MVLDVGIAYPCAAVSRPARGEGRTEERRDRRREMMVVEAASREVSKRAGSAKARARSPATAGSTPSGHPSRPRVLVAYDGSEASERALARVVRFVKAAELAVVTVARPIYTSPPYSGYADPADEEEAKRRLQAARETLERDGMTATGYVAVGDAAAEILRTANVFEAELIVLGARSLGVVGRAILGSVSTRVMHGAGCDVLIVK